jgi:hypothetical protein
MEATGQTSDPRYAELLNEHHDAYHVLRMPVEQWSRSGDPSVRPY